MTPRELILTKCNAPLILTSVARVWREAFAGIDLDSITDYVFDPEQYAHNSSYKHEFFYMREDGTNGKITVFDNGLRAEYRRD